MNDRTLAHFENLRQDARDEIKRRIEQRDKYSIQMTIALGALIGASFARGDKFDLSGVLIAVPLVSVYFTVLILYSYRIHRSLAQYLRDKIEPALAVGYGTDLEQEWESYYNKQPRLIPGIRRWFFLITMLIVTSLSLGYLWSQKEVKDDLGCFLTAITVAYSVLVISVSLWDIGLLSYLWQKLKDGWRRLGIRRK